MFKLALFAVLLLSGGSGGEHGYTGPNCLGPYCADREVLLRSLFERLGQPATKSEPFCYQYPDGRTFLLLSNRADSSHITGEVLLSDFPNCANSPKQVTADNLATWKTKEGIGLGSSEEEVLKAYGKPNSNLEFGTKLHDYMLVIRGYRPTREKPPQIGDTRFMYYTDKDLEGAQFGFRQGRICWIWLGYK